MTTIVVAEGAAGRPPTVRLTAGLLQPRLVSRSPGFAHVALVAGGATLLGGDAISITVDVGSGCTLRIEDIGGTVAYPATGSPSEWSVDATVADEGTLVWESFPFVVADNAVVNRRTSVRRGRNSVVCMRETLVMGRSGEDGGRIVCSTDIRDIDGTPSFVEELTLDGADPRPGVLGTSRVLDTALMIGLNPEGEEAACAGEHEANGSAASANEPHDDGLCSDPDEAHVMVLARPGAMVRAIGSATHAAHVDSRWQRWRNRAERSTRR